MTPLWLILDVETTGLDPDTAGVWQLGAVFRQGGREVESIEMLVRPEERHWTPEHRALARRISGLTAAEELRLPAELTLPEALCGLVALLLWHEGPIIATSYNLPFERGFLDREPAALSRLAREAGLDWRWGPCLMAAAVKALAPGRERLSLRSACAALDIPWSADHRALADARLAALLGERLGAFAEPADLALPLEEP